MNLVGTYTRYAINSLTNSLSQLLLQDSGKHHSSTLDTKRNPLPTVPRSFIIACNYLSTWYIILKS